MSTPRATSRPSLVAGGFFVLRTPLLPLNEWTAWGQGLRANEARSPSDDDLAADLTTLRARLAEAVARPFVQEAIFLASPSLYAGVEAWLRDPTSERGRKAEGPLLRYFARMAGRATPFGLFAGCTVGTVGATTELTLAPRADYRRHTRLDIDYLAAVCVALGRDPTVRRAATYRPNSSLCRVGAGLRFVEVRLSGRAREFRLVAVEISPHLEATLQRAARGARLDALGDALVSDGHAPEDAESFVAELVDGQILVPDLSPQVTGLEPARELVEQLARAPETADRAEVLRRAQSAIEEIDAGPLGAPTGAYTRVAEILRPLPASASLARLFQSDLSKPAARATLGPEVVTALIGGIEALRALTDRPERDVFARFRDAFNQRYDGCEVPLAEALDDENGVGFDRSSAPGAEASPLLVGLSFGGRAGEESVAWGPRQRLLFRKLEEAQLAGRQAITLSDDDLAAVRGKSPLPLPDSVAALATLAAPSADAIAAGRFEVWLRAVSGPSGANLLARFCHGDDELLRHVRAFVEREQAHEPDAIWAEIVHLPEGRVGNVLLRPQLRDYEIAYHGRSGAPADRQIPLDDLMVRVEGARVRLRSRALDREVIPRLTTAHNFMNKKNLAVYRFLTALPTQGVALPGFAWGSALESATFLPRVTRGRAVLALARWRIASKRLAAIRSARGRERLARLRALRDDLRLARYVTLVDGENQLPVDLDNPLSVESFLQETKDAPSVVVSEMWPSPDGLCVRGPEGAFAHEMVVPFTRALAASPRVERRRARPPAAATAGRVELPGSRWLYAKLYTGPATADRVLRSVVAPVVREALTGGAADRWFFVRYGDPHWHVRLRLHGDPRRLAAETLPHLERLARESVDRGESWKLQLDTYERELVRYGGEAGLLLGERWFSSDSDAALTIVESFEGDEAADARWRLALLGMDLLLDDLRLSLDAKATLARGCRDGMARELAVDARLERQLGLKFRKERVALERLLDGSAPPNALLVAGWRALRRRSEASREALEGLRALDDAGALSVPLLDVASSYLHMIANRVLRASARAQELVLYDFLARLYEGRLARERKRAPPSPPR